MLMAKSTPAGPLFVATDSQAWHLGADPFRTGIDEATEMTYCWKHLRLVFGQPRHRLVQIRDQLLYGVHRLQDDRIRVDRALQWSWKPDGVHSGKSSTGQSPRPVIDPAKLHEVRQLATRYEIDQGRPTATRREQARGPNRSGFEKCSTQRWICVLYATLAQQHLVSISECHSCQPIVQAVATLADGVR